jgi:hypothetical protein
MYIIVNFMIKLSKIMNYSGKNNEINAQKI